MYQLGPLSYAFLFSALFPCEQVTASVFLMSCNFSSLKKTRHLGIVPIVKHNLTYLSPDSMVLLYVCLHI